MGETVSTIFDKWPSLGDFAADAGVTYGAAKQMRRRGSIPAEYWRNLLNGAAVRGLNLAESDLIDAHATQPAENAA